MKQDVIRQMEGAPDVDLENRILRAAPIATNRLARDGWIILPDGISLSGYVQNSVVLARHGWADSLRSPVIGRSIALVPIPIGVASSTQFADTELGREYAYLYGVNSKREIYMRAWSFRADVLESTAWSFIEARKYLGAAWDEEMAELIRKEATAIQVATRTLMLEYSAVAIGSDRAALQRAYETDGIAAAGTLVAEMDLLRAQKDLEDLRREQMLDRGRIEKLEHEIQALCRDGASAAARGDSEAIVRRLDELLAKAKEGRARTAGSEKL